MAFKTSVMTDKAFKNLLGYAYSEEEKNYWEEGIYFSFPTSATDLWLDSGNIVHDDPDATVAAGIAVKYDQYVMTANSSAFYNGRDRSWNVRVIPGDENSDLITGFIPHVRCGNNFMFRLYDNDDNLITVPQMITEGIIFDYSNGVVVLNDDSVYTFNVPFKITVWKYSGQTGEDITTTSGGVAGEQRVYYDSWIQYRDDYPSTNTDQQNPNERYAPFVVHNFSLFGDNCKWEFHNFNTGETVDDLSMPTVSNITAYQNANVANDGTNFTQVSVYKPYDTIDERIPVIDKLYGMNRLYGALKGKRDYKNGYPHCGNVSGDFIKAGEIMWAMFDAQFPVYSGYITASGFLDGFGKYGVWLSADEKKLYGIPKNNASVYFAADPGHHFSGRYNFCENWEGPNPMSSPEIAQSYYLTDAKICSWNGTTNNTGNVWLSELYKTGSGGPAHVDEVDITPSRDATQNSLDNNLATYDSFTWTTSFEYRWNTGTKKINKCELIFSADGNANSADLEFYYIPPGETSISNYIHFYTYNYTGGIITNAVITAAMSRDYEWCDGIYILTANVVGEGQNLLKEFDAYEYVEIKTILPHQNRSNAILAVIDPLATSLVFFRAINSAPGTGERDFAVYAKPLGIDMVWINYVDFTKYDLEVVILNRDRQKSRFRVIPQSQTFHIHSKGDQVGIPKSAWLQTDGTFNYISGGWKRLPEAYFRLRDKTTKKVGRLSRSKIKPVYDHGSIPLKFIVV